MQAGKRKDHLPDRQSSSSPKSFDSFSEDASPEMEKDEAPVRSRKSSRTLRTVRISLPFKDRVAGTYFDLIMTFS